MRGKKSVIILGAGASYSYEGGKIKFPLQNNFYEALFKEPYFFVPGRYYHLNLFLKAKYGFSIEGLMDNPIPIEKLLSDISVLDENIVTDLINGRKYDKDALIPVSNQQEYIESIIPQPKEFIEGLRGDVYMLINYIINSAWIGVSQPCPSHLALSSALDPGDTVISFNYDTLMDYALLASRKWNFATGYGLLFRAIVTSYPGNPKLQNYEESDVTLLKLHGSINWGIPIKNLGIPGILSLLSIAELGVIIFPFKKETAYEEIYAIGPTEIQIPDPANYPYNALGEEKIKLSPGYFLPPYPQKDITSSAFQLIWSQALQALLQAQEIVIIGYSLPEADKHVYDLFNKTGMVNQTVEITLVDPYASDPKFRRKFAHAFKRLGASNVKFGATNFKRYTSDILLRN